MRPPDDPEGFIRTNTRLLPVPHAPEIRLHVADEATALWQRTEDELQEIGLPPPFWAFAWAGGQALARYLLDNPPSWPASAWWTSPPAPASAPSRPASPAPPCDRERPRRLRRGGDPPQCGTERCLRTDRADAGQPDRRPFDADIVLAADVFYERDLAATVTDWLTGLQREGRTVLIGDPGRTYLPKDRLTCLATYTVPVMRSLEDAEVKRSHVWRLND